MEKNKDAVCSDHVGRDVGFGLRTGTDCAVVPLRLDKTEQKQITIFSRDIKYVRRSADQR